MIRFGHLGQWVTISGPRHAVMGSTVKAAVWRYRFVRREAWIVEGQDWARVSNQE